MGGFTLIELLMVIAIIAILTVFPMTTRAEVKVLEHTVQHLTLQNPSWTLWLHADRGWDIVRIAEKTTSGEFRLGRFFSCLLYTSDAADALL